MSESLCENCDSPFSVRDNWQKHKRRYCSKKCAALARVAQGSTGICQVCEKEFKSLTSNQKYCKPCVPNTKASVLWNVYRVKWSEWLQMLEEQGGLCLLCKEREATSIDHNHKTGEVRGILCKGCNVALAFVENSIWLTRALNYLGEVK